LGELNRIFYDRYGPEFPDDSAGREDLEILLRLHALHPTHGRERVKNAIETRAPWLAKETAETLIHDFATMDPRRFWGPWWRDELKLAMNLTTADRERLRAWHIPPIDKSDAELAQYRKDRKNAKRMLRRRKAGVKPREVHKSESSKSKSNPWESEGISRATWFRRRKRVRETRCGSFAQSLPPTIPPHRLAGETQSGSCLESITGITPSLTSHRVSPQKGKQP
jgi:hypothetical protein